MEIYIPLKGQLWDLFSFELGKQSLRLQITQPRYAKNVKISYNPGTEPTLNHAISIVSHGAEWPDIINIHTSLSMN